jgi:hypothetical protein
VGKARKEKTAKKREPEEMPVATPLAEWVEPAREKKVVAVAEEVDRRSECERR